MNYGFHDFFLAAIGGWKGLRPSQPSVAASLQFLGAWPPVLQKKNHATFYSETGYVTVMAVKLKKICLGIIELLLLKIHTCILLLIGSIWCINLEYRLHDFSA